MIVKHAFATHVGCIRTENQDCYADLSHRNVFAIADGMGGHHGGKEASLLAVKAFSWQADHGPEQTSEFIKQAHQLILRANVERGRSGQSTQQMGTTGVVVFINPDRGEYTVSWCGDSRLYHWSKTKQKLEQITTDHSVVQSKLDRGEITPEQAVNEKKNLLEHAIGVGNSDVRADTRKRRIAEGDILILCTDGISNEVRDEEIEKIVKRAEAEDQSSRRLAQDLLRAALDGGGSDNATVGILRTYEETF